VGVSVIRGVRFESECLNGAKLPLFISDECLLCEISLLDSSSLVEPRLWLLLAGEAVQFLGWLWFGSEELRVSSSLGVPVAVLNSQNQISLFRNSSLSISGDGYTSNCGLKSRTYLTYSWSLFQNNAALSSSSSPELRSVSVNPLEFKLSSYRLGVGSLYRVKLTVKHSRSMKMSSASVDVLVQSGDLNCVLVGGELGLRLDGSLLLDLSGSSDSNVDPKSARAVSDSGSDLLFELSCFQISPSYRGDCPSLIFFPLTSSLSRVEVTVNSSSSSLTATTSDVFKIVVTGRAAGGGAKVEDSRRCEKVLTLSLLASQSPVVTLEVVSSSGSKINPSSKLKILGRVAMPSQGELLWSVNDPSIQLSTASLSPISLALPSSATTHSVDSVNVLSLVLVGNSLPAQSSFLFTLKCSLDNGFSSSSSVTISTNSPPFAGVLEVSPSEGVMLNTTFWMFASDWCDEDLPLSYQFGYLTSTSSSSSSSDLIVLRSRMELSFTSTLLPAVSSCAVMVFDQLSSSSRSIVEVSVGEVSMGAADLRVFLLDGINGSQVVSNPDDLQNTLSLTSTVLNQVNCSRAPDCFSLNRLSCSSVLVEGTCGDCVSGFVGLSGPSNTRCTSLAQITRRLSSQPNPRHFLLPPSAFSSSSAVSCQSDGDCDEEESGGLFLECNLQSKLCQPIQQSCPNSCSGHGRCVFVSRYDANVSVSGCGVLDVDCVSRCECEAGYVGSLSCSLRDEEVLRAMEVRLGRMWMRLESL
jgi:hypothetical protein